MKVLSYNIQAAIGAARTSDYMTKLHRQFFNVKAKGRTLRKIAEFISDFDVVCLQEVDLGGRRSGFQSQVERLVSLSKLEHIAVQTNRIVGRTSIHGNAILSRYPIEDISDLKLPGRIQGRGKIICRIEDIYFVNTHLALRLKGQIEQLTFIAENLADKDKVVMVGDLNCKSRAPHLEAFAAAADLSILTTPSHKTYPSWSPRQGLDHIITSQHFAHNRAEVHEVLFSDHLPVSIDITD